MRCVIDKYIPFINGRLEGLFDVVQYLEPESINHDNIRNADVLLIRTRTRCNRELLEGTKVGLIATATIGIDHIDLDYCRKAGIRVCNAPGCNARGVAQYVESALSYLNFSRGTIGIVGVGHVGRLVQQMAERHGFRALLYDPPRQRTEGGSQWTTDISELAREADVITFHTPLTRKGTDATFHLADDAFLSCCKNDVLIINAARGGVVDESALLKHNVRCVIDTWENEPHINQELLHHALIATPHIAGYSAEGKRNATRMILEQLSDFIGRTIDLTGLQTGSQPLPVYDIMQDDGRLRNEPQAFERIRQKYVFR